jgi:hypothetical protein
VHLPVIGLGANSAGAKQEYNGKQAAHGNSYPKFARSITLKSYNPAARATLI